MFYCDFLLVKEKTAFLMSHSRMDQDRKIGNSNWNFPFEKLLVRKTKKFRPVFVNFETTKLFFFRLPNHDRYGFEMVPHLLKKSENRGVVGTNVKFASHFWNADHSRFFYFIFLRAQLCCYSANDLERNHDSNCQFINLSVNKRKKKLHDVNK